MRIPFVRVSQIRRFPSAAIQPLLWRMLWLFVPEKMRFSPMPLELT